VISEQIKTVNIELKRLVDEGWEKEGLIDHAPKQNG
jgi:hypothetical protein